MVTPTNIKARFPEFDSEDDSRIQVFIDDAGVILNEYHWGDKYDLGVSYYVAHSLAIANRATTSSGSDVVSGRISSKSVDGVSVSYTDDIGVGGGSVEFQKTLYGQKFEYLMGTLGVTALVI